MDIYVGTDIGIYHVDSLCEHRATDGHKLYHVKCKYCDFESDMRLFDIKYPKVCKHKSITGRTINFKPIWENNRLANIYYKMISRCYDCNDKSYQWYGEKGVVVCDEWLDNPKKFEEWALGNGYEEALTIDRIDPNGDYDPNNCRWIPLVENSRRAGKVNWVTIEDITMTGRQWAEKLGLGILTIDRYIRLYGEDKTKQLISRMLEDPISNKNRKRDQTWFAVYGINI